MELDLVEIYANLDKSLVIAQNNFENTIKKYGMAREDYALKIIEYEKAYAEAVKKLKEQSYPVTIIKEMAKLECIKEYEEMIKAEVLYKKLKAYKEGFVERINTIKFLGKIKYDMFNTGKL